MSKELIEKARELSAAATPGPWCCGYSTVLCAAKDATTTTDRGEGLIAETVSTSDRVFIAESRTLLPALADLAESEGRRADQLHRDIVHCREVECGHYIAERDMARDEVKRLDAALVKSAEYIAKVEAARDAALAELAALKGQQP